MGSRFERIVRAVARRPRAVLAAVAVLAIAGAALALRLEPSAGTDTLVDEGSSSSQATERYRDSFGDEAVLVLVKGDLQRTMLTADLGRLVSLEGCLSGNVPPEGLRELPRVCSELARDKPAKVVYGPGTFVNTASNEILKGFNARRAENARQAAEAGEAARRASKSRGDPRATQRRLKQQAEQLVQGRFVEESLKLALRYGLTSLPSLDNTQFVSQLVFDPSRGTGEPKARFAYLFPSKDAALVQVRLRPELSESARGRALGQIRRAVFDPRFKPQQGGRYVVTGVPVVVEGLAEKLQSSIFVLLLAALVVMAGTLTLVFRSAGSRLRMLPLGLAVAAAALAFGAISLAGAGLTMAGIAALPVLIGLAVDYSIQFHARFDEEREYGGLPAEEAAPASAALGGPTIAAAGLSTIVGFLVLLLSPVPMVRGFGVLLVIGIVLAFGCALTAGFALLVRFGDRAERPADVPPILPRTRARLSAAGARLADTRPGLSLARGGRIAAAGTAETARRALWSAITRPGRVLAIGIVLAAVGWVADTQTEVVSDVRELVPAGLPALRDVNTLQEVTGVSGQIDVMVQAADLTDPAVIGWMTEFQRGVLAAHGYAAGETCAQKTDPPELCPALSLPDLFRSGTPSKEAATALLQAVPPYFSQAVITQDRKTATMAFGIRLMPLERQQVVIEDIQRRLDPPAGVRANVVGLPVLAAQANDKLASTTRRALTLLAALAGVFLVLLAIRRSRREAFVPLIPIALATGWSALVLFLLQIPLNPMSATLGALVIAISTEFSVLLSARFRAERDAGAGVEEALDVTYASTGAAVLASGATAIAGFAALIVSDIRMLRDFGIVTVVDLTVALLGVMIVLPAALAWAEGRGPLRLRDIARVPRPRLPRRRLPRLRRRPAEPASR